MSAEPSGPHHTNEAAEAEARAAALKLVERCGIAMVGANDSAGFPRIKAMIKVEAEGLGTLWFGTNASSSKVARFREDPRASVYFVDMEEYQGLLLTGTMEVLSDRACRERVWRYGDEIYYPSGIDDPDYCVLRFTAAVAEYYHSLTNTTFTV